MFVRSLHACTPIIANDLCELRELFNPVVDAALGVSFSLAHAIVRVGERTIRHHLDGATEVYYVLSGHGRMHIDEEARDVGPGEAIVIPPGAVQWLENTGTEDVVFLALVEPGWRPEIDVRDEAPEVRAAFG